MILILSEKADVATDLVIDRLIMDAVKVIRIDEDTKINHVYLNGNSFELGIDKNRLIKTEEIEKVWFRRPHLLYSGINKNHKKNIQYYLQSEWNAIVKEIYRILAQKEGIVNIAEPSKLNVLTTAKQLGLNTPSFFITDSIHDIPYSKGRFIVKGIKDNYDLRTKKYDFETYTEKLDFDKINGIDSFFPNVFQERIENLFDLKVIFLKESLWPVGIYTNNNSIVDFRKKYDSVRYFSWRLPVNIQNSINLLMKYFSLDFGILDFIVTPTYEYYFLEINPWGQFMDMSINCGYNIDYEIYKILAPKGGKAI